MKSFLLRVIIFYQKTQSLHLDILKRLLMVSDVCRFHPTCSQYTYQAIEKYGALKGSVLGLKRVMRCHPWNKGGYDPVK
ncbi:MAG: membrane protein insertion efficiency factor YidD [Patescibacteria group bacterium]|jgi:hypothetical protein